MKKTLGCAVALLFAVASQAFCQSSGNFRAGPPPLSAKELNQAFQRKADYPLSSISVAGLEPIIVTFPAGVTTIAFDYTHAGAFTATQTFSAIGVGGALFNSSNILAVSGNGAANSLGTAGAPVAILGTTTGTGSGGNTALVSIGWTDVATNITSNSQLTALNVVHFFGGAGTGAGFRSAANFSLSDQNGSGLDYGSQAGFSGIQAEVTAVHNNGGTNVTPRGDWFGASYVVTAGAGATFLNSVESQENDITVLTGANVAIKASISIINGGPGLNDAVHGSLTDAGIVLAKGPAATVGWLCGLCFGRSDGGGTGWPIDTTNGAMISDYANGGSPQVKYGIKWTDVTFTNSSIAVPGLLVGPTGDISATGPINGIGVAAITNQALTVQGATTDNTAFALAVQNSSGVQWLFVRNDGLIQSSGLNPKTTNTYSLGGSSFVWSNVFSQGFTATSVAPTVAAGQIGYGGTTIASGTGTCPTGTVGGQTVLGCIVTNIAGTSHNVPYF